MPFFGLDRFLALYARLTLARLQGAQWRAMRTQKMCYTRYKNVAHSSATCEETDNAWHD